MKTLRAFWLCHDTPVDLTGSPHLSRMLDMSRWAAAGLVLLYHVRLNVLAAPTHLAADQRNLLWLVIDLVGDCGPQAVMWFFVISGLLVGGKVVADVQRKQFQYGNYAINRIARLYVVLIPALALGYAMDLTRIHLFGINFGAGSETLASYGWRPFLANLFLLQTIKSPVLGSNVPLWSLACEGWYYVLFPLLVLPFQRYRSLTSRIGAALLAMACVAFVSQNPKILLYFACWLLGVALWFCPRPLVRSRTVGWIAATICLLGYPVLEAHDLKVLAVPAVAISFASVLLTARHSGAGASLPRAQLHAALAGFSYSLYLTHGPLLIFVLALAKQAGDPRLALQPGWRAAAWMMALVVVTIAYAWVFSRLTEAHTNRVRSKLRLLTHWPLRAVAVTSVLLVFMSPSWAIVAPPLHAPQDWRLSFDEEFTTRDLSRWDTTYPWGARHLGNGEQQLYVDPSYANGGQRLGLDPFSIADGILTITADRAPAQLVRALLGQKYTSGLLTTAHSFSQLHGYFEMRAKFPAGTGLWPAFWMGTVGSWPPEIDVVECLGDRPTTLYATVHYTTPDSRTAAMGFSPTVPDMTAGFHTYGVLWTASYISWYFDGRRVAFTPTPSDMQQPMYLILNLAVGGSWPGLPNSPAEFPARMQVDYVRAYAQP